jgi:chromosome segregation ATPase
MQTTTPETDAAWQADRDTVYRVETSRKLERERDEARNKMADALQEVDLRALDFERMKEERDDALSQIYQAECRAERFCQERDEAREELNNIRLNLGEDAEGYTLLHAVAALQNERDDLHYKLQDAKQSLEVALQELSSTNK